MSTAEDNQEEGARDYAVQLLQSLFKSESYSDVTIRILPEDDATGEGRRYNWTIAFYTLSSL